MPKFVKNPVIDMISRNIWFVPAPPPPRPKVLDWPGLNSISWPGLLATKTVRNYRKLIFPHKDFIICILSLAIFHLRFIIRILASSFYHSAPSGPRFPGTLKLLRRKFHFSTFLVEGFWLHTGITSKANAFFPNGNFQSLFPVKRTQAKTRVWGVDARACVRACVTWDMESRVCLIFKVRGFKC